MHFNIYSNAVPSDVQCFVKQMLSMSCRSRLMVQWCLGCEPLLMKCSVCFSASRHLCCWFERAASLHLTLWDSSICFPSISSAPRSTAALPSITVTSPHATDLKISYSHIFPFSVYLLQDTAILKKGKATMSHILSHASRPFNYKTNE